MNRTSPVIIENKRSKTPLLRVGVLFALSELILQIMTGVLHIIPYIYTYNIFHHINVFVLDYINFVIPNVC